MDIQRTIEDEWPFLLTLLGTDLERSAREWGALDRKREVKSAADLLRLALVYGFCGLSLRDTSLWARQAGVAELSAPALWKRLNHAADWLGRLVLDRLAERAQWQPPAHEGARLRLIDASVITRPGSEGTDFRLHLGLDLRTLTIDAVQVTTGAGGETFQRWAITPGEILIGDGVYGHRAGIAAVVEQGGAVIVRLHWYNMPLEEREGTPFDLWQALRSLGPAEIGAWEVQTAPGQNGVPALPGRLLALRKSPQAAEAARRKLRQRAQKSGKTPSERSLEAAGSVMVFTTLPAQRLSAAAVLELYRFRWQIELAFKRLKSLLGLDAMAAHREELCRTFLLAQILGALLLEQLSHRWVDFSPWGYRSAPPAVGVAGVPVARSDAAARHRRGVKHGAVGGRESTTAAGVAGHAP